MNFFFENPPDQGGLAGVQAPVDMTEEDARAAAAAFDDEDMGRARFGSEAPQGGAVDLTAAGEDEQLQRVFVGTIRADVPRQCMEGRVSISCMHSWV